MEEPRALLEIVISLLIVSTHHLDVNSGKNDSMAGSELLSYISPHWCEDKEYYYLGSR